MNYTCTDCDMTVEDLVCGKCHKTLVLKEIEKNGKKIKVSKCPVCDGMVKSPQCCGKDMEHK